ncbi:hypothetical protein LTR78_009081 [Recurvomyces mirabilis]|uniref:BZIP domain-containing protein n=1 Tax=Recurvomyces mirabilis TaxID=574656 RepID=A0AAE0TNT1_9PEZI|nr:hypothetical protein LTR78_009081 [Recurvomyces mirabilis]KAK5161019.1 hypothetical protein LTS14_000813 [Recurvomyces mirabilis]
MDSLFDFNQSTTQQSPVTASASHQHDLLSPYDDMEERHQYGGPSHDYNQYKQQVGLPVGSVVNMPMSQPQMFDSFNSGIDTSMDGFYSGIDLDADLSMDFNNPQSSMPAMFFPDSTTNGPSDNFVNPNAIQEESAGSVGRLWPGMHSQQARTAAMQKQQQTHAMQQRQMKLQAQHAHYRQASNASQTQVPVAAAPAPVVAQNNSKRPAPITEPHVEESISRLLNQMRHQSAISDEDGSQDDNLPHIARMKKDEDDMDEDERLLNSDEGKKLSSKERRQLRNKVSARAFRSRRKEYISQLEGELALKAQESNSLRQDNSALMQENQRYRGLIETLLRHPAFTPFINDISKDPTVLGMPQQQTQHLQAPAQTPAAQQQPQQQQQQQQNQNQPQQDVKPEFMNFDAGQLEIPSQQHQQPQQQQQQINLAMIPEENFSKLNLNNGLRNSMNLNGGNHFGVNAYAVTDLPPGPDPRQLLSAATYDFTNGYDFNTPSASDLLARLDDAARRT